MNAVKKLVKGVAGSLGLEIRRKVAMAANDKTPPFDMEADKAAIIRTVSPFTMTSPERIYGLLGGIDYITEQAIEGDIVECGVWRGGSMLAAALRLKELGRTERTLWLYDTFEGMPAPDEHDFSKRSGAAQDKFETLQTGTEDASDWCRASLEDVQNNLKTAQYPEKSIRYIKGKVEDTIPASMPDQIALLRLDTDWYASTKHELEYLFPRLVPGGVLIIDDYGHWEGCRKAVDEYFKEYPLEKPLLVRVDYTGRVGIKPALA
ncbi:MAG: class I SAM-dependent methyltransferase [Alphaproteobacteria bacterium]|nr:class I SAM-dependent methyltransferase [Alphaproteobacteria bacterium]